MAVEESTVNGMYSAKAFETRGLSLVSSFPCGTVPTRYRRRYAGSSWAWNRIIRYDSNPLARSLSAEKMLQGGFGDFYSTTIRETDESVSISSGACVSSAAFFESGAKLGSVPS